jgi:Zn-dependent M16 (insulinase) family peptidase
MASIRAGEASVNTTEFKLREQNSGHFPRGLVLMLAATRSWLHGYDPIAPLAFEAPLGAIKRRLATGERLFEGLIEQQLITNPHRTTVRLDPDPTQGERENRKTLQKYQNLNRGKGIDDRHRQ